jgi:peptidoglycan/LPS O-acetylase OafA/YrhL
MHAFLHLAAKQPQWLAEHADAYADLVAEELGTASAALRQRALLGAVALCGLGVAAVLAGVAAMLWAVIPPADIHAPWALFLAPLLPALVAAVCLLANRQGGRGHAFDSLRQQLKADFVLLREMAGP